MAVRRISVSLPEELYELIEKVRAIEHRSRSDVIQEALRTYFGEAVYTPSEAECSLLQASLKSDQLTDDTLTDWSEVRRQLRAVQ